MRAQRMPGRGPSRPPTLGDVHIVPDHHLGQLVRDRPPLEAEVVGGDAVHHRRHRGRDLGAVEPRRGQLVVFVSGSESVGFHGIGIALSLHISVGCVVRSTLSLLACLLKVVLRLLLEGSADPPSPPGTKKAGSLRYTRVRRDFLPRVVRYVHVLAGACAHTCMQAYMRTPDALYLR